MDEKSIEEILDIEDAIQSPLFEQRIDALMEILQVDPPPDTLLRKAPSEEEVRKGVGKIISDSMYNREERRRSAVGFQLLVENLDMVPNADQCRQELEAAGRQLGEFLLEESMGTEEATETTLKLLDALYREAPDEWLYGEEPSKETEEEGILDLSHVVPMTEVLNISDEVFSSFYRIGTELFEKDQIEEAASVFQFLSYLDVLCHETWYSQALCFQKLERWPEAIANYSFAALTDPFNISTYLNLAECYLAINDTTQASNTLSMAETMLADSGIEERKGRQFNKLICGLKDKL
ncbi:MAG: hypothetical protein WB791_03500 [Waddliaceae bacterium]